jgi:hypothetical protein
MTNYAGHMPEPKKTTKEQEEHLFKLTKDILLDAVKYAEKTSDEYFRDGIKEITAKICSLSSEDVSLKAMQSLMNPYQDYFYNLDKVEKFKEWIIKSRKLAGLDDYVKSLLSFNMIYGEHFCAKRNVFTQLTKVPSKEYDECFDKYDEKQLKQFQSFLKEAIMNFSLHSKHKNVLISSSGDSSPHQLENCMFVIDKLSTLIPFFDFFTHEVKLGKWTEHDNSITLCKEFGKDAYCLNITSKIEVFDFKTTIAIYQEVATWFDNYINSKFKIDVYSNENLNNFGHLLLMIKEEFVKDLVINFFKLRFMPVSVTTNISIDEKINYAIKYEDFEIHVSNSDLYELKHKNGSMKLFGEKFSAEAFFNAVAHLESLNQ